MKRLAFLDWMRGLAVVVMIQCHVFDSFIHADLREGGAYTASQFIGGMAGPLFLFMAGMTFAFLLDRLDGGADHALRRWWRALGRAGYILAIAFGFRLVNWAASLPRAGLAEIVKVDILNCMGVALAAVSVAVFFDAAARVRFAIGAGLVIAAAAPLVNKLPWDAAPALLRAYLVPMPGTGQFSFFPCAAYAAFGLAAGAAVRRTPPEGFDRLMQWLALIGFPLVFASHYFATIPFSLYPRSDFWSDSPALIFIRTGVMLAMLSGAYLWTQSTAGRRWSWMECLGRNSLMVYCVHIWLVYGDLAGPVKRRLSVPLTTLAMVMVMAMMVGLSVLWMGFKSRRAKRSRTSSRREPAPTVPA